MVGDSIEEQARGKLIILLDNNTVISITFSVKKPPGKKAHYLKIVRIEGNAPFFPTHASDKIPMPPNETFSSRSTKEPALGDVPRTIRIGVSSCLLGEPVRWDGGHKRHAFLVENLAQSVELVPVCPEVGIGLGVPRKPIRLVRMDDQVRAVGVDDPTRDVTDDLRDYARRMLRDLPDLHGYLFKSDSPSCGPWRVKVFPPEKDGAPSHQGVGLFAQSLMDVLPLLPVEDESSLDDPALRDRFLDRVVAYARRKTRGDGNTSPCPPRSSGG